MSNPWTDEEHAIDSDKHLLLAEIVWLAHKAFPGAIRYLAEQFPGYTLVPYDRPELYYQGVKVKLTAPCRDYQSRDSRELIALVEWHVAQLWKLQLFCTSYEVSGSAESRDLSWFGRRSTVITEMIEAEATSQSTVDRRWKQRLRQKVDRWSVECALWKLIHKNRLIHDAFPFGFDLRAQAERLASLSREECEKELATIDAQLQVASRLRSGTIEA